MSVLQAKQLAKSYRGRSVVKEVNLHVHSGEVVGLLGPNGAGKTTSFYMVVGLIASDQGRIFLNSTDISRYPMHKRAQLGLGYLPQEPSVFRKLSVEDNILAILELQAGMRKKQRQQRLEGLLKELGITHLRKSMGMSLSGGERRRVEIARALAANPRFILLDEPFAGIDPLSVIDIQNIITHLRSLDIGVLITDHNVRETLGICERAYIVNEGTIIAEGAPNTILQNEQVKNVYLGHDFSL
ncbi:LPS export ABC transporter ATP-binding protein [Candidatus Venteria ishoeyi]|uniref:Lipopolysaccharide export system ATP-binding protein LptB n=1 Tax=Candidatus Venteria ishoeyi TaxID=1899563 RepID=A0A1H6FCU6_9GAMM|nr:LPS export ABC transporter ATP-binding protein [Candidatus Venteria ishoeyi]MDM8544873.1 LPS export ABC transporter ATP-binding protein [Candidatus Venteria ishoeyi]SEH07453.1 Lipopolysaccharide export system ATP-binding protein LptB [Candidatus Venteria ishoeyi]